MEDVCYIRVATEYYKVSEKPTINGHKEQNLIRWKLSTINQDHSTSYKNRIPQYDDFCCLPSHLDFQQDVDGYFNLYSPLPHKPCDEPVIDFDIPATLSFIRHIFGEQVELGLDYLQLLYEDPVQKLPILCLVSSERETGKTTFLRWLSELFGKNMTFIRSEGLSSQFNADWLDKLLIGIDEALINEKVMLERLKNLATATREKLEQKGKDRRETDFFGKFVLCSNNEESFVQMDRNENRFWVRKIPVIPEEIYSSTFFEELKSEIPQFLRYLLNRELSTKKRCRLWFDRHQIATSALEKVVENTTDKLEIQLIQTLYAVFEFTGTDSIVASNTDIAGFVENYHRIYSVDTAALRKILKKEWNLNLGYAISYQPYIITHGRKVVLAENTSKERTYTIHKSLIIEKAYAKGYDPDEDLA